MTCTSQNQIEVSFPSVSFPCDNNIIIHFSSLFYFYSTIITLKDLDANWHSSTSKNVPRPHNCMVRSGGPSNGKTSNHWYTLIQIEIYVGLYLNIIPGVLSMKVYACILHLTTDVFPKFKSMKYPKCVSDDMP